MIVGNKQAVAQLEQFFSAVSDGRTVFPFLLVSGPRGVGKTTLLEQLIPPFVGPTAHADVLSLYDLTDLLGKEHTLKIEAKGDDALIEVEDRTYQNMGMREVIQWLSLAPVGRWKVVFLEHIERMSPWASHALLKSLEEPQSWRIIIATTTRLESILETIRSRAFLVRFDLLAPTELIASLHQQYPSISDEALQFASAFSGWAYGRACRLLSEDEVMLWAEQFYAVKQWCESPQILIEQIERIKRFEDRQALWLLLDALQFARDDVSFAYLQSSIVRTKRLLETNIKQEQVLYGWCLDLLRSSQNNE